MPAPGPETRHIQQAVDSTLPPGWRVTVFPRLAGHRTQNIDNLADYGRAPLMPTIWCRRGAPCRLSGQLSHFAMRLSTQSEAQCGRGTRGSMQATFSTRRIINHTSQTGLRNYQPDSTNASSVLLIRCQRCTSPRKCPTTKHTTQMLVLAKGAIGCQIGLAA